MAQEPCSCKHCQAMYPAEFVVKSSLAALSAALMVCKPTVSSDPTPDLSVTSPPSLLGWRGSENDSSLEGNVADSRFARLFTC